MARADAAKVVQMMGPSSPGTRGTPGSDLKSRWAAISSRARETLSRTQKEWKTLWGRPAEMGSPAHAGPSTSTPPSSLAERAGT